MAVRLSGELQKKRRLGCSTEKNERNSEKKKSAIKYQKAPYKLTQFYFNSTKNKWSELLSTSIYSHSSIMITIDTMSVILREKTSNIKLMHKWNRLIELHSVYSAIQVSKRSQQRPYLHTLHTAVASTHWSFIIQTVI